MKVSISFFLSIALPALLLSGCTQTDHSAAEGNHLLGSTSPYLLQHAYNPVDWYPWGEEALGRAQEQNQLIILSIGYASCHWCHVMEEESFEDSVVARVMNRNFVSIKVDREERPDIDQIYMDAATIINGRGGWPLNAILLPDGRPFYATTYLPKDQWLRMLGQIQDNWERNPARIETMATSVMRGIRSLDALDFKGSLDPFPEGINQAFLQSCMAQLDGVNGGRKGAPKFPLPVLYEYLLQSYRQTGDSLALEHTTTTLEQMALGGIHDQVGGGFARYATDENWHVPHFEKMLYDNAQLISLYSHAYQATGKDLFRESALRTIAFAERELASPEGAFYSSLDADSGGEEGSFYTWTVQELQEVLGEGNLSTQVFAIEEGGNWEGAGNILSFKPHAVLEARGIVMDSVTWTALHAEFDLLLARRAERVRPALDDKILCSWNSLMLSAYCDAFRAFGEEGFRRKAITLARFIDTQLTDDDGGLFRSYKEGSTGTKGFLDDYALTAKAYVDLYEISFEEQWLQKAKELMDYTREHFKDQSTGLYFYTSALDKELVIRKKEITDDVIPSSNAVMAENLHRLGLLLYIPEYEEETIFLLNTVLPEARQDPSFYAGWASLLLSLSQPYYEVAIVGEDFDARRAKMQRKFLPQAVFLGGAGEGSMKLLKNKSVDGETMIYVCLDKSCRLPVMDAEHALSMME